VNIIRQGSFTEWKMYDTGLEECVYTGKRLFKWRRECEHRYEPRTLEVRKDKDWQLKTGV
jgi:hypothetical protein